MKSKNKLLATSLIGLSSFLIGCQSYPPRLLSSGYHLQGATQLKVFASNIEETRPHDDSLMPNSVILLDKSFLTWGGFTSQARNRAMCEGFMKLEDGQAQDDDNKGKPHTEHRVFNYMLLNPNAVPGVRIMGSEVGCDYVLKHYNYEEANKEINRILPSIKTNRSPYLAVYEPKSSPHTSMVLALGTLGTTEIEYLVGNWEALLTATYKKGEAIGDIDSAVYLAVMIAEDPLLQDAARKDLLNKIEHLKVSGSCGASLIVAGTTLSLTTLLSATTTTCTEAVQRARKEITGKG